MEGKANRVLENLKKIQDEVSKYNPKIVAVSKYYGTDRMIEAYNAGLRDFGESRLPEAVEKINSLDDEIHSDCNYHLIGHLQSNKVKWAVGYFNLIHSVDSIKLADEISKKALTLGIIQHILIQVNNAIVEQKFGMAPSLLVNTLSEVSKLKGVELIGLMNIAPLTDDVKLLKRLFDEMYHLKETFKLKELSMGMSNDYKIALDSGATIIRIGRKLFE